MKWKLAVAIIVTIGFIGTPAAAQPGGPAGDRPIEVTVQLGTATGDMVVIPRDVVFEKGQQYKLVLTNPSDVKHRFSVRSFSPLVMTRSKLEIDKGTVIAKPYLSGRHCHINRSISQLGQFGSKFRPRRLHFAKSRTMRSEVPSTSVV